jgi:hypothetical protein
MVMDAHKLVVDGHKGGASRALRNSAESAVRTMSGSSAASTGVGVAITAGVVIAGIATGGLAIPVLIGLGAGAWAIKKAIAEIGADYNRNNRNWLKRFNGKTAEDNKENAKFLTCESADAIRRAVDHYRMVQDAILPELQKDDRSQYATCEDAINHIKSVARFIHHADKVRNYTLPALDMLIFYLEQYEGFAIAWKKYEADFSAALVEFFRDKHGGGECVDIFEAGLNEGSVCYAPNPKFRKHYVVPCHPHVKGAVNQKFGEYDATGKMPQLVTSEDSASPASAETVEVKDLIEAMKRARQEIINGMHVSDAETWNYSAERPLTGRARANAVVSREEAVVTSKANFQKIRLDAMIDAVWRQVDRPGYFERGKRRMGHWYTRHNKSEKAAGVISEMLGVGSIFLPFLGSPGPLLDAGKKAVTAVSSSVTATTMILDTAALGALRVNGAAPVQATLLNPEKTQSDTTDAITKDIRGAGLTVVNFLPKLMLHFGRAAEGIKKLNAMGTPYITNCSDAFQVSLLYAEIVHEMNKVGRYMTPCIGMVDALGAACKSWSEQEAGIWRDMEAHAGQWIRDEEVHQVCRTDGKHCYGSKHHKVASKWFGRGDISWHELSNDAHKPI